MQSSSGMKTRRETKVIRGLWTAFILPIIILGPTITSASSEMGVQSACDRLAASSYDENSIGEPVTWLVLRRSADQAIAACQAAVEEYPETPRFKYQLGRALDAAERYEEAATWYRSVAELPYSAALAELAVLHSTGKGLNADAKLAYALATRAAEMGNLRGSTIAAALQGMGKGTEKDLENARAMMLKAAESGNGEAMEFLGDYYLPGVGTNSDEAIALDWYTKAAEKGRLRAAMAAGRIAYKNSENKDQAYYWIRLAARGGHAPAMTLLGTMLLRGEGTQNDTEAGIAWLERAASQNDIAGLLTLGRIYESGKRVAKDLKQARAWYEKGVAASSSGSAYQLARGYDKGHFGNNPALAVDYLVFAALAGFEPARKELLGRMGERWTEESRKALQTKLASEGLYSGAIDGVIGQGTAVAIARLIAP